MPGTRAVDVVVVGGGPAGCAAALELARKGTPVLVVDRGSRTTWPGESLPPGAARIIEPIFGTQPLQNERHRVAYGNRSAWGSEELVAADFIFNPLGTGWHIDRRVFDRDLARCAMEHGVQFASGLRVAGAVRAGETGWQVTLSDGSTVSGRFLVDATGRSARIARMQGSRRVHLDRQVALVGEFFPGEGDLDSTTLVEATRDGWWYTSPLPGGRRVVAFLTDGDLLPEPPGRSPSWQESLRQTRHVSDMIGGCAPPAALVASPAETSYLENFSGPGWLAVGDAAIAWDPLSSQGIATAILMGGRAGGIIADLLRDRGDDALREWTSDYRELLRSHDAERRDLARAEQRWPDSLFWARRHKPAVMSAL